MDQTMALITAYSIHHWKSIKLKKLSDNGLDWLSIFASMKHYLPLSR
jgi:hypothetical protein